MPKTFKQNLLFTAMMSLLMVYVMILLQHLIKYRRNDKPGLLTCLPRNDYHVACRFLFRTTCC